MKWIVAVLAFVFISLPSFAEPQMDEKESAAIDRLTKAIATDPTAHLYAERGQLYERNDMHDLAAKDFTEALKLVPNDPGLLWRRGMALAEMEKYKEALADCAQTLKRAERGDIDYMQALRIRTHCFEVLHRDQEMVADFRELAALGDSPGAAALKRWENDHKGSK